LKEKKYVGVEKPRDSVIVREADAFLGGNVK
jgi:hypothetical protein